MLCKNCGKALNDKDDYCMDCKILLNNKNNVLPVVKTFNSRRKNRRIMRKLELECKIIFYILFFIVLILFLCPIFLKH